MKVIVIDGVGEVTIRKSRLAKRIILKISQTGHPVVSIPSYAPYALAEKFARQHADWFIKNMPEQTDTRIYEGKQVGRTHYIHFNPQVAKDIKSRISNKLITITYPSHYDIESSPVQAEAAKASIRALRREAESYLPGALHQLALRYGYKYSEVRVKAVTTRWGSCSSGRIINLSIWLMQIPEELVQYVLCHELTHLNHMNHSTTFWDELSGMIPDYKARKKLLREYSPKLI